MSYEITNMWNVTKSDTKELTKQKQSKDFKIKLTVTKGENGRGV